MRGVHEMVRCRSRAGLLIVAVATSALLAACGSNTNGSTNGSAATGPTPRSIEVNSAYAIPANLDPTAPGAQASPAFAVVNEALEISGVQNAMTPQLATSVSTPNATTLVYHLRKNVQFSNGDPLTAEDVAWSLNRAFRPTSSLVTFVPTFKSASVTGPDEVTVRFKVPTPAARGALALATFVQDKKYAEAHGKDFGTAAAPPIGTGPYRVAKMSTESITLVRNDRFWGPKPPVKTITLVNLKDDNTALLAMRSGALQVDLGVGNPRNLPQWKGIPGTQVYPAAHSVQPIMLSMDITKAPFNDIHVRRAIAYAVDRKGLIQAIYGGQAQLLQSVQPLDGFAAAAPSQSAAQQFLNTLPQYDYNIAKAKAELAQSAYPHGFSVTIPYWAGQGFGQFTALSMQQSLRPLGIHVTLKPLTAGPFLTQQLSGAHRGMQIVRFTTYPQDPVGGLTWIYGTAYKGSTNYANFFSPATETAWKQVTQSVDNSVRWQGVQTLMRATAAQLPYVPLFNEPEFIVTKGVTFDGGSVLFPDLYNDQWALKLR